MGRGNKHNRFGDFNVPKSRGGLGKPNAGRTVTIVPPTTSRHAQQMAAQISTQLAPVKYVKRQTPAFGGNFERRHLLDPADQRGGENKQQLASRKTSEVSQSRRGAPDYLPARTASTSALMSPGQRGRAEQQVKSGKKSFEVRARVGHADEHGNLLQLHHDTHGNAVSKMPKKRSVRIHGSGPANTIDHYKSMEYLPHGSVPKSDQYSSDSE
jgi:hypothetical protein